MAGLISVSVMAHPSREEYFPHLERQLGDVPWAIDEDGEGSWPTARRAWQLHDPEARFHVVVQDDAIVCDDFYDRAARELRSTRHAYSLYYAKEGPRAKHAAMLAKKRRHGRSKRLYWGVAIALPTRMIEPMVRWVDEREEQFNAAWGSSRSDTRVGRFLRAKRIPVRYPLPCLVDHRVGASLIQKYRIPPSRRVAVAFIDRRRTK